MRKFCSWCFFFLSEIRSRSSSRNVVDLKRIRRYEIVFSESLGDVGYSREMLSANLRLMVILSIKSINTSFCIWLKCPPSLHTNC